MARHRDRHVIVTACHSGCGTTGCCGIQAPTDHFCKGREANPCSEERPCRALAAALRPRGRGRYATLCGARSGGGGSRRSRAEAARRLCSTTAVLARNGGLGTIHGTFRGACCRRMAQGSVRLPVRLPMGHPLKRRGAAYKYWRKPRRRKIHATAGFAWVIRGRANRRPVVGRMSTRRAVSKKGRGIFPMTCPPQKQYSGQSSFYKTRLRINHFKRNQPLASH